MSNKSKIICDGADKLLIREFTFDEMVPNATIAMIAKRNSGKSWVTGAMLHHFREIPVAMIISRTEKNNPYYSNFFPDTYIYYEYTSSLIRRFFVRQDLIIKKCADKKEKGKFIDPRGIIIMDDCLSDKGKWANDPLVKDLMFNGRHKQLMYILTMQFPLGLKPEFRVNFDYVFLLKEQQMSNLKRIYEHYAGGFPTFDSFYQVFNQLTQDHGCMVIINTGKTESFFDKIAFYKAPDVRGKELKFGCRQFRKFHKSNYDKEWKERESKRNIEEYLMSKQKKEKISVKKIYNDQN
jgi:hypothetical protein